MRAVAVVFAACVGLAFALDPEMCDDLQEKNPEAFKDPEIDRLCELHHAALNVAEGYEDQIMTKVVAQQANDKTKPDNSAPMDDQEMEKRKNEYMRFGKRKNEYMRFGKRKNEYMRFGKRKNEYMRFGRSGADTQKEENH